LLTGKLPFKSDSQYSLMTAHLNDLPAAPITLRSDLPASLNEIIMIAMAKDPAQRFQSADAFRAALQSVPVTDLPSSDTTLTDTPSPVAQTPKPLNATTLVETPLPPRVSTVAAPKTPAPAPTPAPVATTAAAGAPAFASQAQVPPPGRGRSSGHGLWVAIGALVGIGVLIAAGIYIPRHIGTHADLGKSAPDAVTGNGAGANTSGTTTSAPPAVPPVAIESDRGSIKVDPQGNVEIKGSQGSISTSANGGVKIQGKSGKLAGGDSAQDAAPAAPPVPAGPSPEEVAKMEDEADQLNTRAATVVQSVETLRKQQIAAGYNLRADMASAEERMQLYLAKGNAALQAKDLVGAKKYFDLADPEIAKLEKFMGR
jgi:serine/threonine-protein kinase